MRAERSRKKARRAVRSNDPVPTAALVRTVHSSCHSNAISIKDAHRVIERRAICPRLGGYGQRRSASTVGNAGGIRTNPKSGRRFNEHAEQVLININVEQRRCETRQQVEV